MRTFRYFISKCTLEGKQNLIKTWQDVRDRAAESSAIIHVINAEQWAKRLTPLLSKKETFSARAVYAECDTDLSGYQTDFAYSILKCYWKHAELLVWRSFSEFLSAATKRDIPK